MPSETSQRARLRGRGSLLLIGRIALGVIFLMPPTPSCHFDGGWHFGDYHFFFAMAINSYNMLPLWAVEIAGANPALVWKLLLGALLIPALACAGPASITSALLLVFIGAMTRALILGFEIKCGCFGNNEKLGDLTLLRDSGFLFCAWPSPSARFSSRNGEDTVSS